MDIVITYHKPVHCCGTCVFFKTDEAPSGFYLQHCKHDPPPKGLELDPQASWYGHCDYCQVDPVYEEPTQPVEITT